MAAGANEIHQPIEAPLLEGLKARDPRASGVFFDRYAKRINGLVYRLLGPDGEHSDIVQTVFLEAMAGIDRVQSEATLEAWLRGIAVNTVRAELRRRKRRRFFFISDGNTAVDTAPAIADSGRAQRMQRVYALLDRLAVDDRQAFALRYIEAHQLIDAAALAGTSLATFKRRLKRATDKMLAWSHEDAGIAMLIDGEAP